ncbi:MAG: beta-galactosidase [Ignavibacteriaceae bacterium]
MRKLIREAYIPFGSQYYRAPSPYKEEWEKDLHNMAKFGFNTVKFWVQWRWNNPAEGKFYFDDIDRLMELAQKNNLKVMLNTIFDVAPAWIYKMFPDASMITLSGVKVGPQTQPHRQIGGLGYCFNHDGLIYYFFDFLSTTIRRYKDHPALEIWNLGSEPELTSSMAELRRYANDADKISDMLCYCDSCQSKFKVWLNEKYKNIEKLNICWNRNYQSFNEVETPKTRNTFNDIIDWRMFFVDTIGQNVRKRFEVARGIDKGKHPLMCHHVFIQGFPVTSTANDPWNIGRYGDLHGFTQMDDPAMIDILRSCAKDKPVISAEMLMLPGYTLDLPKSIDENDVKKFIFRGIAGNLKGFIFWQYRPEILGRETPTWGLTYLNGEATPWLNSFAETGKILQRNADFLLNAKPQNAEIAILYNPENQIFAWASTGNEMNATGSLLGYHRALYEKNFNIDFIHPKEFEKNILGNYKVVIIPFPYVLSEKISSELIKWVHSGGVLISECYTGGWNIELGEHEKTVPGYKLNNIFKVRQSIVQPSDENENVKIITTTKLPYLRKSNSFFGSIIKETFFIEGAKSIAKYSTGEPAITIAEYGNGKAILIGSYIGLEFYKNHNKNNRDFIAGIVEMAVEINHPKIKNNLKVRVDYLIGLNNEIMLIIQNLESKKIEAEIYLPLLKIKKMKEQFTGDALVFISKANGVTTNIKMKPREVKVFRA